jgi:hypothetical protein
MLSQAIWWASIGLEALLLGWGIRAKLASRYPVFYCYISFVLVQDLIRLLTIRFGIKSLVYTCVYWTTEFQAVLFGCAIVFEIFRVGLAAYPGTARMARNVLAFCFALALAKAIASAYNDPQWWLESNTTEIERALRTVQAIAMVAFVVLCLLYSISFGKNLRGILVGYGLFIGARVISLVFVPVKAIGFWSYAYSISYSLALGIWVTHLWSYSENPVPQPAARLEADYQRLAAATRRRLQAARGQLAKAVRS